MKHLQMSAATILSLLAIAVLVCLFAVMPTTASAGGIEYTIGNGSLEGDPTDGLDYSGGSGDILGGSSSQETTPISDEIFEEVTLAAPSWLPISSDASFTYRPYAISIFDGIRLLTIYCPSMGSPWRIIK